MSFPKVKGVTYSGTLYCNTLGLAIIRPRSGPLLINVYYQGPALKPAHLDILTEPAIKFIAALHRTFDTTRHQVRFLCL